MKEMDERDVEIGVLKRELGVIKIFYENYCLELEREVKEIKVKLEEKIKDFDCFVVDLK